MRPVTGHTFCPWLLNTVPLQDSLNCLFPSLIPRPKFWRDRETAGAMGAPPAKTKEENSSPLSQQREVGGDAGGGRPENGGVSWGQSCGELRPRCHEHCKCWIFATALTFLCIKIHFTKLNHFSTTVAFHLMYLFVIANYILWSLADAFTS